MCTLWASKAQFFDPKVSKNPEIFGHFLKFFFTGFPSVLLHILISSTFSGVWHMGIRGPILGSFWVPKISHNSGLWSFAQKVFTGFTSVLLDMFIASTFRCVENMGFRGPQINKISSLWSFSKKNSTGFASVLAYISIWATFRGVSNISLRGPISRSFWAPK